MLSKIMSGRPEEKWPESNVKEEQKSETENTTKQVKGRNPETEQKEEMGGRKDAVC